MSHFVQLRHPWEEHRPWGDLMPWNQGPHRRKFLISPGRYVEDLALGDEPDQTGLAFWGEWEPPSRVEQRWPKSGRLPQYLHRPHWVVPRGDEYRQNTDPWIWGDRMIYSCCKQTANGKSTAMQRLDRGSVVCFGSKIDGAFCLDTVFVVASAEPWAAADAKDMDLDDAFRVCTASAIVSWECAAARAQSSCTPAEPLPLVLYRGATYDDPVDGMFSFVPARRAGADTVRFARPSLDLPDDLLRPASQNFWGALRALLIDDVRAAWEQVGMQVLVADLVLATWLQTPTCEGDAVIPETQQSRC
jgi:hypothetical protein